MKIFIVYLNSLIKNVFPSKFTVLIRTVPVNRFTYYPNIVILPYQVWKENLVSHDLYFLNGDFNVGCIKFKILNYQSLVCSTSTQSFMHSFAFLLSDFSFRCVCCIS